MTIPVPSGDSDVALATAVLDSFLPYVRLAADAGNLLRFDNHHWYDWGTRSEARDFCASMTVTFKEALPACPPYRKTESGLVHGETGELLSAPEKTLVAVHRKLSMSAGQSAVATAMLRIARSKSQYHEYVADLDSEPHIFWAGGNPVDLLASTEEPVVAEEGTYNEVHKHTSPYVPDYDTATPKWDRFLSVLWDSGEMRRYAVREVAAVALWGATSKRHPVLEGPPGTGKSTLIEAVVRVLGSYAVQVSPEMLIGHNAQGSAAEEQKYRMLGARLVWLDEPPGKGKQALSQFKDLASGTGSLSASRKYQNEVTAERRYNFVVCQNKGNRLNMAEPGVAERLILIPCGADPLTVKEARDEMLAAFESEAPGILARLIVECARHRNGEALDEPFEAAVFRESLMAQANGLGAWLSENYTVLSPETPCAQRMITIGNLRLSYNAYARGNNEKTLDRDEFREALALMGVHVSDQQGPGGKRNQVAVSPMPVAQMSRY